MVFTLSMWNGVGFRCGSSLPCQQTDITMELFSLWSSPCPCRMTLASGAGPPCPVNKQILRWSCFHFGLHLVHVEWRRLQVRVLPALSTNRYYDGAVFTLVFTLSMWNDIGFRCGSSLPCQQQISPWRTELIIACTLSVLNGIGFMWGSSLPCQQQISPWRTELIHVAQQILRWSCFHFGLHLVHVE